VDEWYRPLANGLSPGQRRILTVAVEVVSNAPVFFLDEPTSGLDSRAALIVMTEVHKVGRGRLKRVEASVESTWFQRLKLVCD
jgi:ABC-type multidrug transport system ATPase subunit